MTLDPPLTVPPTTEWPSVVRRYMAHLVIQRVLAQHEGWPGVMQWLFCGQMRRNDRLPYAATVEYLYPIILKDAEEWDTTRRTA